MSARLERALIRSAAAAGARIVLDAHRSHAWHSATFAGEHHELEGSAPTDARLDGWLARLAPTDLDVPGAMLAELTLAGCDRTATTTRFRLRGLTVTMG